MACEVAYPPRPLQRRIDTTDTLNTGATLEMADSRKLRG